ncbi:MAG TPA: acyl-[acyl-carrier-protein]--UDP-N-acetylglucosamine O-acyltransferase, partial [candidate division WOR-3 bacterium]|nr:acyl-[acyl-carrier-protein]--UDP-N-acetylglucosamine O-acyltransferase [candidate division WOR-3 bacterium]
FRSNLNTHQAIEKIENQMPMNEDIRLIIDFIKTSKRGIVKGG